jgi:hypothetical protein
MHSTGRRSDISCLLREFGTCIPIGMPFRAGNVLSAASLHFNLNPGMNNVEHRR